MTDKPYNLINNYVVNFFTDDDLLSIITNAAERVGIRVVHKKSIKLSNREWFHDQDSWKYRDYLIVGFHINNSIGCVEIKYDSVSKTNYLECKLYSMTHNTSIFDFSPYTYQLAIKNNGDVEDEWTVYLRDTLKTKRVLTYKKINSIAVQATSVIVRHNSYGAFKSSSLSKKKTMILNPNEETEILYTKLKLTYYMAEFPILFKEITNNKNLSNILEKSNDELKRYITLLEMSTI